MANSIKSYFGGSLHEQNWYNFYVFNVGHFAEIIHIVVTVHQVDVTEILKAAWIVMIAVNHENRYGDTEVFIHIVGIVELVGFVLYVLLPEDTFVHHLLQLEKSFTRGLMLVKQITTKK